MARLAVFVASVPLLYAALHVEERPPPPRPRGWLYASMAVAYQDSAVAGFHYALLTGDRRRLGRNARESFRRLCLLHFLTPSGLHLGFVVSVLCAASRRLIWATPLLFLLDGFHAAKRVLVLLWLRRGLRRWEWPERAGVTPLRLFFGFFALDFLFGSYAANPASFAMSFLFLGVIHTNRPLHSLFFGFMGAQIMISLFLGQTFSPTGFAVGFALTPLLALTFPVYLTGWHPASGWLGDATLRLVDALSRLAVRDATLVSLPLAALVFVLLVPGRPRIKAPLAGLCLLLHASPVLNLPSPRHFVVHPRIDAPAPVRALRTTGTGWRADLEDGGLCYFRLRSMSYETDCR